MKSIKIKLNKSQWEALNNMFVITMNNHFLSKPHNNLTLAICYFSIVEIYDKNYRKFNEQLDSKKLVMSVAQGLALFEQMDFTMYTDFQDPYYHNLLTTLKSEIFKHVCDIPEPEKNLDNLTF